MMDVDKTLELTYKKSLLICGGSRGDKHLNGYHVRRCRTAFTRDQVDRLEMEFLKDSYVSRSKRRELASCLNLLESTIKVWFQNRRMKDKRHQIALACPYGIADPHLCTYIPPPVASYWTIPLSSPVEWCPVSELHMTRNSIALPAHIASFQPHATLRPFQISALALWRHFSENHLTHNELGKNERVSFQEIHKNILATSNSTFPNVCEPCLTVPCSDK